MRRCAVDEYSGGSLPRRTESDLVMSMEFGRTAVDRGRECSGTCWGIVVDGELADIKALSPFMAAQVSGRRCRRRAARA